MKKKEEKMKMKTIEVVSEENSTSRPNVR